MKAMKNPVAVMDSVEALDLMIASQRALKTELPPCIIARLDEQIIRHRRALLPVIWEEDLN